MSNGLDPLGVARSAVWRFSPLASALSILALAPGCIVAGWGPERTDLPEPEPQPEPEPEPPGCPIASSWTEALIEPAASGGIESITVGVNNSECAGSPLWVYRDCCYGVIAGIERLNGDGTVTPVDFGVDCICGGPVEPVAVAPGDRYLEPIWAWYFPEDGTYRFVILTSSGFDCPSGDLAACAGAWPWNEAPTFWFDIDL